MLLDAPQELHGKSYSADEQPARRAAYEANVRLVQESNARNGAFTLELNRFADLTCTLPFPLLYAVVLGQQACQHAVLRAKARPRMPPAVAPLTFSWLLLCRGGVPQGLAGRDSSGDMLGHGQPRAQVGELAG